MVNLENKKIILLLAILALSSLLLYNYRAHKLNMNKHLTYIITDTKEPDSFDPLEADSSNNLPMMRMLYASILQVNSKNELYSILLKSFSYNSAEKKISLIINTFETYSDGTSVTPKDIVISILRVALNNPNFPVTKDILGIENWRLLNSPLLKLPDGITISENKIEISLSKQYENPLFRFCLELFTVIPEKCFDLKTNKMICNLPPSSGYYEIEKRESNIILFKKRNLKENPSENIFYDNIEFKYISLEEQCSTSLKENEIIASNELSFLNLSCRKDIKASQIKWLPASRFGMILINPNMAPFNDEKNRRIFSNEVRRVLESEKLIVEASIFTKLIPGYLSRNQLKEQDELDDKKLRGTILYLPKFSNAVNKQTINAILVAAKNFEMKIIELNNTPGNESINKFLANEASLVIGSSGFWAQDPIGDLSMFFSENLHKPLAFVWKSKKTNLKISEIENETDPLKVKTLMEQLNRQLYNESLIAPVMHFRRLFITHENIKSLNLPMAVTSPAPWHLVPVL